MWQAASSHRLQRGHQQRRVLRQQSEAGMNTNCFECHVEWTGRHGATPRRTACGLLASGDGAGLGLPRVHFWLRNLSQPEVEGRDCGGSQLLGALLTWVYTFSTPLKLLRAMLTRRLDTVLSLNRSPTRLRAASTPRPSVRC